MNRVNAIADINIFGYDQRDSSLFAFQDYFHFYKYPVINGLGTNNCSGYVGDPYVVKIPFRVKNTIAGGVMPILNDITVSIIAIKAGQPDCVLETRTINVQNSPLYNNRQQVNYSQTKGYISYPNDPFNTITLKTGTPYVDGAGTPWQTFMLQYPFVLRYDFWNAITAQGTINNDIITPDNDWTSLQQNGWSIVLRFTSNVAGYDNFVTGFTAQAPLKCTEINGPSETLLNYIKQTTYYDDSNGGAIITTPKKGGVTRIRTVFTYNGYSMSGIGTYFGYIFIALPQVGGVYQRRFASSEIPSEAGSPFSATPAFPYNKVDMHQWAWGGLRLGWFVRGQYGTVWLETNYNDKAINWSNTQAPVPVIRLGFKNSPEVLTDEHGNILDDEHGRILTP